MQCVKDNCEPCQNGSMSGPEVDWYYLPYDADLYIKNRKCWEKGWLWDHYLGSNDAC